MKMFLPTALASLMLIAFTGGANFIASYFLDIDNYARYANLHMYILYTSAILTLSISYCAPRLTTASAIYKDKAHFYMFSLTIYACIAFIFIGFILSVNDFISIEMHENDWIAFFLATTYVAACQNIYAILFSKRSPTKALAFISISVSLYLFGLYFSINLSELDVIKWTWMLGMSIAIIILYIIIALNFKLQSISRVYFYLKDRNNHNILFPSMLSGVVNGAALLVLYNGFSRGASSEDIAYLGFAFMLKTVLQFFSQIFNRVKFLDLSDKYIIGTFKANRSDFMRLIVFNVLSVLLSLGFLIIMGFTLFYEYFSKFSGFPPSAVAILSLWIIFEAIYFSIYQFVQVNGKMWASLFFISFPSLVYALLIDNIHISYDLLLMLILYFMLTLVSIISVCLLIFLDRNKLGNIIV